MSREAVYKKLILSTLLLLLVTVSCEKSPNPSSSVDETKMELSSQQASEGYIPYADSTTLKSFNNNPEIVNYKMARKIALIQMNQGFAQENNWEGMKLSEKPVVIYDDQSRPKYYEFLVTDESGKKHGTITTHAKKEHPNIVSHVLSKSRDYETLMSKGNGNQFFDGGYPGNVLTGVAGKVIMMKKLCSFS